MAANGGGGKDQQQEQVQQQVSAPVNAQVDPTLTKLLTGVQGQLDTGAHPFAESTYAGVGDTTKNAWALGKGSAINPAYNSAVNAGINYNGTLAGGSGPSLTETQLMDTAMGKNIGVDDPGYAAVRAKLSNDVRTQSYNDFNNSGLFGSDNNMKSSAAGLTDSLGALDLGQYNNSLDRRNAALAQIEGQRQQGVNNAFTAQNQLPGLYGAAQLPSATLGAIGSAEDADRQAALQGRYDLSERLDNATSDRLAKLAGVFGGSAPAGGQQQTTYQPAAPWWQGPLSFATGLAGSALRAF